MMTQPLGRSVGPDKRYDPPGPAASRAVSAPPNGGGIVKRLLLSIPGLLIALQAAPVMASDTVGSPAGSGRSDIVQSAQVMVANDIIERFTAEDSSVDGIPPGMRLKGDPRGVTVVGLPATPPTVRFHNVEFALGSAELTDAARRQLDEIGTALASDALSPYGFRISGHTDATGTEQFNLALSERRANAVRDYLTSNYAISGQRLEAIGLGETAPADPGDPFDPSNRRVEITRTGTGG